jgi:hypothetical protein
MKTSLKRSTIAFTLIAAVGLFGGLRASAGTTNFLASGIWTAPAGITNVTVEMWGGGGGGGGSDGPGSGNAGAGGGGGGAYTKTTNLTVVPGTNYTITVGAGGTAGALTGGNGGMGGNSTFTNEVTLTGATPALGGGGGTGNTVNSAIVSGGAGGIGTYNGGTGGSSGAAAGGGGGGGAGSGGNGGDAAVNVAGVGGIIGTGASAGGNGGAGKTASSSGVNPGIVPGGGGAGAYRNGAQTAGAVGGAGMVAIVYASAPTVTSPTATAITDTTATLGANAKSDVISLIAEGTVWGTSPNPTGNFLATGSTANGVFTQARTGLPAGTLIYYRGYVTNALGASYSADGTFYTLSTEPAAHVTGFTATGISGSTIDLSWTAAVPAPSGYLILQKAGAVAPTGAPLDTTSYAVNNVIGDGTVVAVVTPGTATTATITGLTQSSQYSYAIFPFNWDGTTNKTYNYNTNATVPTASAATQAGFAIVENPTQSAITDTSALLGATVTANGGNTILEYGVVMAAAATTTTPTVGNTKIVTGTTESLNVPYTTNTYPTATLAPATQYYFAGYASNSAGVAYSSYSNFTTLAVEPTVPASAVGFSGVTLTGMTVSWTAGNGSNHLVVVKAFSAPTGIPADGTGYAANAAYGTGGTALGDGFVVYNSTGTSVAITGLTPGTPYHVAVYERNGSGATANYLTTAPATGSQATSGNAYYSGATTGDPISLAAWWSNPDGTGSNPSDFASADTYYVIQSNHVYSASTDWTVTGGGGVQINRGGTLVLNNGSGSVNLNLGGSLIQNGVITNSATSASLITFTANGSWTGSGNLNSGGGSAVKTVTFNVMVNPGVTLNAAGLNSPGFVLRYGVTTTFTVNGTLDMGTRTMDGSDYSTATFNLGIGGTLVTAHPGGVGGITDTPATGTLFGFKSTLTPVILSPAANYVFNGTSAQVTGLGLPATGIGNLTITNSAGVTLSRNVLVSGTNTMQVGALSLGGFTLAYGAVGALTYAGTTAQTASAAEFPAAGGPKTLVINNAAGVTVAPGRAINGTLFIQNGKLTFDDTASTAWRLTFDGSTLEANGTWGNTGSGATHVDSAHFAGSGYITIALPPNPVVTNSTQFRSIASGNWNSTNTWEASNDGGSVWLPNPNATPSGTNAVYIQGGHTVTLTGNTACGNLSICSGATAKSAPEQGVIHLDVYTLAVSGQLRAYLGTLGVTPGASSAAGFAIYPFAVTSTDAKVSIVGNTRSLTTSGTWSTTIDDPAIGALPLAIDLNADQTVTLLAGMRVSGCTVNTGTFDIGTQGFNLNNGVPLDGNLTIASGARFRAGTTSLILARTSTTGIYNASGTLWVKPGGTLEFYGSNSNAPVTEMSAFQFDGTVVYSRPGGQILLGLAATSTAGLAAVPTTYNNLILQGSGVKRLAAADTGVTPATTTVNGTLTIGGTATLGLATTLTTNTLAYGGSATLQYAGTAEQTTAAAEFPATGGAPNLQISNTNGVVKLDAGKVIAGTLTVEPGAHLDFNSQTLTVDTASLSSGGALTMAVNKTAPNTFTGSLLTNVTGTLTYAGTLFVTNTGSALELADSIPLFVSSGGFGGGFSSVTGPVQSGLAPVATQLTGGTGGNITFIAALVEPVVGAPVVNGSGFSFTLTGPAGQSYSILSSTNLAIPLAFWTVADTGVFGPGGTASFTNSTPTYPQQFYQVTSP